MKYIIKTIVIILLLSNILLIPINVNADVSPPTNVSISPSVFSPDGNGLNDTTAISFDSTDSGPLYLNIYYNTTQLVRSGLTTTKTGNAFRATWDGRNDAGEYVSDGVYTIRVTDTLGGGGSEIAIGTATVDTVGPTDVSLSINGGNTYTTSRNVTLTISATGATKMMISNYANFSGAAWETYTTTKSWQLLSGDETKTVYIKFRDSAGATSITNDSIILDTTIPTPSLTINEGDSVTNNATVTLTISASGATYMRIDNDTNFANMSDWIPKANTYIFTMPNTEGVHTVYLQVKDDAGNTKIASDSITLDTIAPSDLSISINNGASYTNNITVTLTLSANGGPVYNWLSNNGINWNRYQYSTTQTWNLSNGEGLKTVYYKARDSAGNNATAVTATITLDTTSPTPVTLSSPSAGETLSTQTPTFSWNDPNSDTGQFKIEILQSGSVIQSSYLNSSTTSYTAETLAEGSYSWKVTVYDLANNSATTSQRSFTVSVSGLAIPSPAFPANGAHVNDITPKIQWSQVSGATSYEYRYGNSSTNLTNTGLTSNLYVELNDNYDDGDIIYWQVRSKNTTTYSNYSTIRSFIIDTQEPILNSIQIDNGATYTTSKSVTLTINVTGANWMKISEDENFSGVNWVSYTTSYPFTLSSGDGVKTIYLIAKDNAVEYPNINNSAINDTIILDTQAPYISNPVPSSGASITTTNPVIQLTYGDNGTGVNTSRVYIRVDNSDVTSSATISDTKVSYTLSSASTGEHTVNVTIHDDAGHVTYYNWSFTITTQDEGGNNQGSPGGGAPPVEETDNPPVITDVTHSPSKITSNDTVTITAVVTDDIEVTSVDLYWNDGTLHSKGMTLTKDNIYSATIGPFEGGITVTYYIKAVDNAPQETTSNVYSFTVEKKNISKPPSSKPPSEENIVNLTVNSIAAGGIRNISLEKYGLTVEKIKIKAKKNIEGLNVNIEELSGKPSDIPEPLESVYIYFSIETDAEEDISMTFTFKVEKTWLDENNLDKNTVKLLRYHNDKWQPLKTSIIKEDNEYIYYESETPGLSIFAITAAAVSKGAPTSVEVTTPSIMHLIVILIAGIITAVLVAAIYYKKRSRE
ncbi:MAG: hypothetical protein DRN12_00720 [Thermoplasmata archaeon]|nr:MAG: hypothetical protein DRN12_00720 [Thermoplasmata archaeon]